MDYKVSGRVVNESGEPVKGIGVYAAEAAEIRLKYADKDEPLNFADTTGVDGKFNIANSEITCPGTILLVDTDGAENGQYDTTKVEVNFTQVKKADGHWYDGAYEATDLELVIKETK